MNPWLHRGALAFTFLCLWSASAWGQPSGAPADLRVAHLRAVRSLVRVEATDGAGRSRAVGSGWVVEVAGQRMIVTNLHVAPRVRSRARVLYYPNGEDRAQVAFISREIDFAVLRTDHPVRVPALTVRDSDVVRGERVVLGGNPGGLYFITTEGVVAGAVSHLREAQRACGRGNNCIVLDAEGYGGSSGGPVVDASGSVIGMVWGEYPNTSLTVAIHGRTLAQRLRQVAQQVRPQTQAPAPSGD